MIIEGFVASGMPNAMQACRLPFKHPKDTTYDHELCKERADKLANTPTGSGHDNFLCGVTCTMIITAPRFWWPELQRYHFVDIVSATSTMHTLFDLAKKIEIWSDWKRYFSKDTPEYVLSEFHKIAKHAVHDPDKNFQMLKCSLPEGFLQTATIVTNYRQLKTIYNQRRNHKLKEWQHFCDFIERVPYAHWIVGKADKEIPHGPGTYDGDRPTES